MGVVRDWGRGIARAGAVALVVPVALALGVALTAAIGGAPRLQALGQLVVGPQRRTADTVHLERAGRLPSVPPLVTSRGGAAPSPRGRRLPSTGRPVPSGGRPGSGRPTGPASGPSPAPRPPAGTPPATGQPDPPPGAAPPVDPPAPNPVRDAGTQAAQAAGALPAPAGPVAQDAVQAVVDLLSSPLRR